ncbi:FBD-associated F-box protein At2g26860-like [Silene latifolia]|uniref:FBD-associated F-box protein At2g26860-like n=1 Tax=Silene latifolia TaxID=37657 RepID=UPI003D779CEB
MKPQKHKCSSEYRDRLSEMPDEVIVHILSYLPIVDAVRTMLIRPFGTLWTWLPTLEFVLEEVLDELVPDDCYWTTDVARRFFIFVLNVLMLHKRASIDKFRLDLYYESDVIIRSKLGDLHYVSDLIKRSELGNDIRMCLKLALDKKPRAIYFGDGGNQELSSSSDYPNFISESLVTLELTSLIIYPKLQVNLGSLKELTLDYVTMSEEEFQKFISGCPSLQVLHIDSPSDIRNLSFSAPNIRKLFLRLEEEYSDDEEPWVLDFPNLKSLDLDLFYGIPDIIHMDVSCVRDVSVCFSQMADENQRRKFKLFLNKFSQSEVLRLSDYASETFLHLLDDWHLLQIRWKRIVLELKILCQDCLLGVYQLMTSSKDDLEELVIYTDTSLRGIAKLPPVELSYPCVMPKLKTVTLHGYAKPWEHQLQLVEFLLKSGIVLEKLVIVPNKCRRPNKSQLTAEEKLDFVMHVSSFQRSSPSARVLFL